MPSKAKMTITSGLKPIRRFQPFPDAPTSANWTAVGICAHESALKRGDKVKLPDF